MGRKDKIISNCFCETKKTIVFLWPLTSVIILLIFLLCALDSFNFFNLQYQEEVHILDSLEIVHPLQGLELFAKMVYYKTHYKFDTEHKVIIDASGPYIENKIINATQIRPFNLKELYDLMKNVLQLRGVTDEIPEYVEGKMFSFIPRKV